MDERLKDIVNNFEQLPIGVDDPFKFHCTMCGKCCYHREDILLNPKDIYNISKELGLTVNSKASGQASLKNQKQEEKKGDNYGRI